MYDLLLAIHIVCAVLWVGGSAMLQVLGRRAQAAGGAEMLAFTRESAAVGPKFFAPLSIVLLIAGILLVGEAGYEQSELFVTVGYVGFLTSFAIGVAVYPRFEKRIATAAASEGTDSAEFRAAFTGYANLASLELLVLLTVVVVMATKPGLG